MSIPTIPPVRVLTKLVNAVRAKFFQRFAGSCSSRVRRSPCFLSSSLMVRVLLACLLYTSELAGELGVHPNYLSALFHRTEGMTVQQYIRRQKIQQAENLLKYSGYQMNEIASYLSFSSQSHLSSCFKKATGMTPGQYRNQCGRH